MLGYILFGGSKFLRLFLLDCRDERLGVRTGLLQNIPSLDIVVDCITILVNLVLETKHALVLKDCPLIQTLLALFLDKHPAFVFRYIRVK